MNSWFHLKPNDIVDVIAPGSRVTADEIQNAVRFLEKWQLVARIPKNLFGRDVICANTDEARFSHLKQALLARDSKMIWCLRGGYGCIRLLPFLDQMHQPKHPKLLIGLSDISSLHIYLNCKWNWPSLHGPMLGLLGTRGQKASVLREMHKLLFGDLNNVTFSKLHPMNASARKQTTIRAQVVGGNLTVVQSTLGTPYQILTNKHILFLEEINERGYRVDRILAQMEQAGVFNKLRAVVFGDFVGGAEPDGRQMWEPVLKRFAGQAKFPVLRGIPSGHGIIQRPIPLGAPANLTTGTRARLVCASGGRRGKIAKETNNV